MRLNPAREIGLVVILTCAGGCDPREQVNDAAQSDGGAVVDAGATDAAAVDALAPDAAAADTMAPDALAPDVLAPDASASDAGSIDAATTTDATAPDTTAPDALSLPCTLPLPEDVTPDPEAGLPFGYLDHPGFDTEAYGIVRFAGWVLSATPLAAVELWIDGAVYQLLPQVHARLDVCAAYPSMPCTNPGFDLEIDLSGLERCQHLVEIWARTEAGELVPIDRARLELVDSYAYACTSIGGSYSDGFFSLQAFDGKLYAGQFGYGHSSQSMLYRYAPWELTSPGLTGIGESICALEVFDGKLWANTENSGDIFSSTDGVNWQRMHDGDSGVIGCGLAVHGDTLYAINYDHGSSSNGRILRLDGSSFTTVYDSGSESLYIREIVTYDGTLRAFATVDGRGKMLSSSDGASWSRQDVANRYFRGHVWDDYLWLGSTDMYADGSVGVWRFDGQDFVRMHAETSKRYVTNLKDLDGHLFASTSNGWKDERGPSSLLVSRDRGLSWEQICQFSETAVWDMAVFDGALYLGTWDYGGRGAVYRVDRVAR